MSIKTTIKDSHNGLVAAVVNHDEHNGLVVATRKLKVLENSIRFFTNEDYGSAMNQDAGFSGTPLSVHDGTDSTLWTATDIVGGGKTTFDSTDQNHTVAGTKSIKVDASPVDDVFQIAKGSDLDCNNYTAITMWIYPEKDWTITDVINIYGWDTDANQQVGTAIDLKNYFAYGDFNTWHKLTIPLSDFGEMATSTILDALRVSIAAVDGKSPKFYIDDIQFEESGTPIKYSIKASNGTWLHVNSYTMTIVANIAGTLADASMPNIPYDGLLGTSLIAGTTYQRAQDGKILFSQQVVDFIDWVELPGSEVTGQGSDGTNTWVSLRITHAEPLILKAEENDELSVTVNDDLSGLVRIKISAACSVETRLQKEKYNK